GSRSPSGAGPVRPASPCRPPSCARWRRRARRPGPSAGPPAPHRPSWRRGPPALPGAAAPENKGEREEQGVRRPSSRSLWRARSSRLFCSTIVSTACSPLPALTLHPHVTAGCPAAARSPLGGLQRVGHRLDPLLRRAGRTGDQVHLDPVGGDERLLHLLFPLDRRLPRIGGAVFPRAV